MFIIFASPRSGTTLLARTLNINDQIVIPDETDFIIPTAFLVDRIKDPTVGRAMIRQLIWSADQTRRSLGEYLSQDDVNTAVNAADYSACAIIQSIYQRLAARAGKRLAGDKSPNDLLFLRILVKMGLMESDIKIIHLIRDVRDVVLSLQKVDWDTSGIENWFPRHWGHSNLYLHELLGRRPDRYRLIRYEDLVAEPERHVRDLAGFLEVEFQDKMLDHTQRGERYAAAHDHKNISAPFLPGRAGAWHEQMSAELRQACESPSREALTTFGYPL
jgi:hypothetical protein